MNKFLNINHVFDPGRYNDPGRSLFQCTPFRVVKPGRSGSPTRRVAGMLVTILLWMFAFFTPQIVYADTAAELVATINNWSQGGSGTLTASASGDVVTVIGTLTDAIRDLDLDISEGVRVNWQASLSSTYRIFLYNNGAFEISGGKIEYLGDNSSWALSSYESNSITVSSGEIIGGIRIAENSTVTVSGGKVSHTDNYAIYGDGEGNTITVSGGVVTTNADVSVININTPSYSGTNIEVSGGKVEQTGSSNGITSHGNVLVSGGEVTAANGIAIRAEEGSSGSTIIVSGTGMVSAATGQGIVADGTDNAIIIEGGTVTTNDNYAIHVTGEGSTVTVSGGTVTANGSTVIYIDNQYNTGLNVVVSGGTVQQLGDNHGIYTSGSVEVSGGLVTTSGLWYAAINLDEYSSGTVTISGGTVSNTKTNYAIILDGDNAVAFNNGGTVDEVNRIGANSLYVDKTGTDSYYVKGTSNGLMFAPAPAATVVWDVENEKSGIRYTHNTNTGFLEVTGITLVADKYNVNVDVGTMVSGSFVSDKNVGTVDVKNGSTPVTSFPTDISNIPSIARLTLEAKAVSDNYKFVEWWDSNKDNPREYVLTDDVVFKAIFTKIAHTVTFMVDGHEHDIQTISDGEKAIEPEEPEKAGHDFLYWYLNDDKEAFDFDTEITEDITLTAKWEVTATTSFTVTFMLDEETEYGEPQTVADGEMASEPKMPEKESYRFLYWYLDDDEEAFDFETKITEDISLTAKWINTYTVTFMVDDQKYDELQIVDEGDTAEEPDNSPEKEGYTFFGWFLDDEEDEFDFETPIMENIILKAKWEALPILTVTFMLDEEYEYEVQNVIKGSKATRPENAPAQSGYIFVDWFEGDDEVAFDFDTEITESIFLTAKWEALPTHTVTFMLDGEKEYEVQTVIVGNKATRPEDNPVNEGYRFVNWFEGDDENPFDFGQPITGNVTLTAHWMKIYTVTFMVDDKQYGEQQTVVDGGTAEEPGAPEKEGFTFLGWFLDDENDDVFDFETEITEDIILTAKWGEISVIRTVTFNYNDEGETENVVEEVAAGETVAEPEEPVRNGYEFMGWFLDNVKFNFETPITGNITLTAIWKKTVGLVMYKVTFDYSDGETENVEVDVELGATVEEPEVQAREGFEFLGWFYGLNRFNFETPITDDIELIAKWKNVDDPEKYTVTFNYNDGVTENAEEEVAAGETIAEPEEEPLKEGFEFLGWFLGFNKFDFETPITDDIELIAKWKNIDDPEKYTVAFNYNDGVTENAEEEVEAGDTVDELVPSAREGYEFLGWFLDIFKFNFETPITDDIELIAKWKEVVVKYTVTFDYNDDEGKEVKVEVGIGETVEEPGAPVRDGYLFLGWFLDDVEFNFEMQITSNITLVAEWKQIVKHTVTFMVDNAKYSEQTVVDGETATVPQAPSKTNYEFEGWFLGNDKFDFSTPIEADITLTAKWTKLTGSEDIFAPNLKVYPNPFVGMLHIVGAEGCVLQVISGNGVIVHIQKIENTEETVRLEQLPEGVYIFRLEKYQQVKTLKVVKD